VVVVVEEVLEVLEEVLEVLELLAVELVVLLVLKVDVVDSVLAVLLDVLLVLLVVDVVDVVDKVLAVLAVLLEVVEVLVVVVDVVVKFNVPVRRVKLSQSTVVLGLPDHRLVYKRTSTSPLPRSWIAVGFRPARVQVPPDQYAPVTVLPDLLILNLPTVSEVETVS